MKIAKKTEQSVLWRLISNIKALCVSQTETVIRGSTVVLTCCKGDCQSQWKTPIFAPSQLGNPLTDFGKI